MIELGAKVTWLGQANGNTKQHVGTLVYTATAGWHEDWKDHFNAASWTRRKFDFLCAKQIVVVEERGKLPRFYSPRHVRPAQTELVPSEVIEELGFNTTITLVVDLSSSMVLFQAQLQAGVQKIAKDNPAAIFNLITFAGDSNLKGPLKAYQLEVEAKYLHCYGWTALYSAVIKVPDNSNAVFIVTDGQDNRSGWGALSTANHKLDSLRRKGCAITYLGPSNHTPLSVLANEVKVWDNYNTEQTFAAVSRSAKSFALGEGDFRKWIP